MKITNIELIIIKTLVYIITYITQCFKVWKGVGGNGREWEEMRRNGREWKIVEFIFKEWEGVGRSGGQGFTHDKNRAEVIPKL